MPYPWLLMLTLLQAPVQTAAQAAAPVPAACEAWGPAFAPMLAATTNATATVVAANSTAAEARLALDRATTVRLQPQPGVRFDPLPSQRGTAEQFAGIVSLGRLPKGPWRVTADDRVRLEVAVGDRLLQAPSFDMHPACAIIRKAVVFDQPADADALLLISGGSRADVRLMVTPVR